MIENVMGTLPQALKIIFEMQRIRSNEKMTRRKINFSTYKTHFFPFSFLFGPLLLSNLVTFLFFIHLKKIKVL